VGVCVNKTNRDLDGMTPPDVGKRGKRKRHPIKKGQKSTDKTEKERC